MVELAELKGKHKMIKKPSDKSKLEKKIERIRTEYVYTNMYIILK